MPRQMHPVRAKQQKHSPQRENVSAMEMQWGPFTTGCWLQWRGSRMRASHLSITAVNGARKSKSSIIRVQSAMCTTVPFVGGT